MLFLKTLILWLASIAAHTAAQGAGSTDNQVTHCLEKLYFWNAYNVAWQYMGEKQNFILMKGKSQGAANSHWGSGVDAKLNFFEFMEDLTNKPRGTFPGDIPEPKIGDPPSYLDTARKMAEQNWGNNDFVRIETQIANKKCSGDTAFSKLIGVMNQLVKDATQAKGWGFFTKGLADMGTLSQYINTMRRSDSGQFIINDLQARLGGNAQVKTVTRLNVDLEVSWDEPDIDRTLRENADYFSTADAQRNLRDWVANYGDATFRPGGSSVGYSDAAIEHGRVRIAWRKTLEIFGVSEASCETL